MLHLPTTIITILEHFAPVFSKPTWEKMKILLIGAILAPVAETLFDISTATGNMQKIPRDLFNRMVETLAYAV